MIRTFLIWLWGKTPKIGNVPIPSPLAVLVDANRRRADDE